MSFAKMIFTLLFFIVGVLVGITEIYVLLNPNEIQQIFSSRLRVVHLTYLLFAISCLGSSYLLFKNFNKTDFVPK